MDNEKILESYYLKNPGNREFHILIYQIINDLLKYSHQFEIKPLILGISSHL